MQNNHINALKKCFETEREKLIEANIFSVRMMVLAILVLGLVIQCGLFLFGRVCSCYPMWFSFISCSNFKIMEF